ncbi:MAG: hypothetical protein R3E83_11205 [Burkholderiaceae bacterium]
MKLLLLLLLAALVSYGIARLLIPVALRVGWVDKPSDRKRHDGEIPLVGGAAVFLTLCLFFYFGSGWANHTVGLAAWSA